MIRRVTGLLCVAGLLMTGCQDRADERDRVLARVGDSEVTVSEFEAEMERRNSGGPAYFQRLENRRALLDELLRHRMLIAEARDAGIDQDPEFQAMVDRMMIQRLREQRLKEVLEAAEFDDQAVAAYYEEHIEEFTRPARRQVAMIRIDVRHGTSDEERAQLRERAEAARAAALELPSEVTHFGEVAVEYSHDRSSRYQGGVVGWLVDHPDRRYQWDEAVLEAAFALDEPGAITPVIDTGGAFYVVRLADFEPARTRPLEQVADGIRHRLRRERVRTLEAELFTDIEDRHPVSINDELLETLTAPAAPAERERPADGPPAMPADDSAEADPPEREQN